MKEYTVRLDNGIKNLVSSTDEMVTELGICLQVWQDLKKMSSMNDGLSQEDAVIQKVLTQILSQELGGEENIDYPEYYEREATKAEVQLPEDGNYYNK